MRLIFVRHGHPDYAKNALTELGVKQAQAAAVRLEGEGINRIVTSTYGRAIETAQATSDRIGVPLSEGLPFMDERWVMGDLPPFTHEHPWAEADALAERGANLFDPDGEASEWFGEPARLAYDESARVAFDAWLGTLGYEREGQYYRCTRENGDVIALFSHGGSSSRVMAHLMNLPFVYFCHMFHLDHTSVCVFDFKGGVGSLVTPKARLLNDARHIRGIE